MPKNLSQSHLVFITDHPLDLPASISQHIGTITTLISKKSKFFGFLSNLRLNWQIRNLHAKHRIDAVVIDHPNYLFDYLKSFAVKHNVSLIADNLNESFSLTPVIRTQLQGFILPSIMLKGSQSVHPVEANSAIVPLALTKPPYWKLAGFKSKILNLVVVAVKPDESQFNTLTKALDVVKSLDPDISVDIISINDQDPNPFIARLRRAHLIINVSSDPVWTETSAAAVAAGIPLISPKRPLHQYIPPKDFPGYIVSDWQIDTLSMIIQNSILHPEETYRIAKNSQHWLKTNLGQTFLPFTWINALQQLLSPNLSTSSLVPTSTTLPATNA